MSKNNSQYQLMRDNQAIKKRLYKSKHGWNVAAAGMLTAGAAATLGVMGQTGSVHADTMTATNVTQNAGAATVNTPVAGATTAATTTNTVQSTPVQTAPVTQNSEMNTANAGLQSAVTQVAPVVNQAGGTISASAPQTTTPQIIQSETSNVYATGSADAEINTAVNNASVNTSAVGGYLSAGSAIDVSSLSTDSIASLGRVQADRITETGVANGVISGAVASNSGMVTSAGGSLIPGSALDVSSMSPSEIASAVSKAQQMVEATGSADSVLTSASNQFTSDINAAGGQLKKSDAINTANNMTASDVDSSVKSQVTKISTVASADRNLLSDVKSALPAVNGNGGKLSAGSVINASSLDPVVIASMVARQSAMISATAKADTDVLNAKDQVSSAVVAVGGVIKAGSHVNTADKMTTEQVLSLAASNVANLQATGAVDGSLAVLLSQYSGAIKSAGAELLHGSDIDVSSMTADQINSLGSQLVANLSMTGQHDVDVMSQAASAAPVVNDMSGVMKPGSVIDVTNWTVSEVQSEMNQQSAMISVTASGDVYLKSLANSASPVITGIGGTITENGVINTANNMTVSDVESSVQSQTVLINGTVAADSVIASAVSANSGLISSVSGAETPGSTIDVSSMTISEVMSIASHQVAMVNATGSADGTVKSVGDVNQSLAALIGGFIKQNGLINTANNMTVDEIAQSVESQVAKMNAVGQGDQTLASAVSAANALSKQLGGGIITGSAVDVTSMTVSQIGSIVDSQVTMASTVGQNNSALLETQSLVSDVVNALGGTIKAGSAVDVTSMTLDQVKSMFDGERTTLSAVGDGDRQIGSAVTNNMNAIQNAGGKILSAGGINMAGKSAADIQSNAKSQAANIVATGQFNTKVPSAASEYASGINTFGGSLSKSAAIDVSSMSDSQVISLMNSKIANLSGVASANPALSTAESAARSAIEGFGGTLAKGSAIDASSMGVSELASLVNSEVAVLSAAGAEDLAGKSAVDSVKALIEKAGGQVTRGSDIAAQTMTGDQIVSLGSSQVDNLVHVVSADSAIDAAMSANQSGITTTVNGKIHIGSVIDAHSMTNEAMASLAQSNATQLSLTGSGDISLASTINATKNIINQNGGNLTSRGAIDVSSMTSDQINSIVTSQQQNMQATAGGDQMLTDAANDVASETTTRGGAFDVSSMTSAQIGSVVASQVEKIGETQNGNDQLHTAVNNTRAHITEIGGKLTVTSMTDTTKMNSEAIASLVASQTGKLDETATGNDMVSTAIVNNSAAISKHGGWIHQGNDVLMNNMESQAGVSHVRSQVAHLNATGSAASAINSAVDGRTNDIQREGATISALAPKDVTGMTDADIKAYGDSVAAHVNHTADGDNTISNAIHGRGNGVSVSGTLDVTGKTDAEIDSLASSIAADAIAVDSYNNYVSQMAASMTAEGIKVNITSGTTMSNVSQAVANASNAASTAKSKAECQINSFKAEVQKQPRNLQLQNGFTALNTWQNVNMGSPDLAYATGAADNPDGQAVTITFYSKDVNRSNIIKSVDANGSAVEGSYSNFAAGEKIPYPTKTANGWGLHKVANGTTLTFKNAVTYLDGSKDDLKVTFVERGDGSSTSLPIEVWVDKHGAINSYVQSVGARNKNGVANQMLFSVGSGKQVVWPAVVDDIDEGQYLYTNIATNNGAFVGVGGGLNVDTYDLNGTKALRAHARDDLGNIGVGKNADPNTALDGQNSEPDGAVAIYSFNTVFDTTVQNDYSPNAYGVAAAMFGSGASLNIADKVITMDLSTIQATVPSLSTNYSSVATNYTPYSAEVTDHLNYTYSPLKTSWSALDVTTTPLSTQYQVFSDNGGYHPMNTSWSPASTSFHALSDDGGYHPETYTVSPLGMTYQGYETDGQSIKDEVPSIIPDGNGGFKLNPKFTGYAPLSVTYKGYESDGESISKDVPPTIPDPNNLGKMIKNPKFTGYTPFTTTLTPLSTSSLTFDSDGSKIPPVIPDDNGGYKPNPDFSGYAPFSTDYHPYSSDGSKVPVIIPDPKNPGHMIPNPKFTGYQPYGVTYNPLSTKYAYGTPKVTPKPKPDVPSVPNVPTPKPTPTPAPKWDRPQVVPEVLNPDVPSVPQPQTPNVPSVPQSQVPMSNAPAQVPAVLDVQTPVNTESAVSAPAPVHPGVIGQSTPAAVTPVNVAMTPIAAAPSQPQAVQPASPALSEPTALPQTGYRHSMAALAGVATMALTLGLGLVARRKHE